MAQKGRPSVLKRRREQALREKRQRKAERRARRKAERQAQQSVTDTEVDPDIAHIIPGPQPPPEQSESD